VLPFFFLSGLLMTPDAPLTAAWAAALYYLERSLIAGRSRAWWGVGLALGFGAISKYTIGLLVPVTLLFMLWDQPSRRWWRSWQPYAAALVAAAVFSPVILWNAAHDWASFAFQTTRRLGEAPRFALHKLIAAVVILITPTGALALTAAYSGARAGTGPLATGDDAHGRRRRRFVALAILVPLSVFALFSLRHEVKLDWTGAPSLAALPVIAAVMAASRSTGFGAWVRRAWGPTLVLLLLIYGAGLHYLVLGLPGIGYSKHTELIPIGWRDLSRQVEGTAAAIREQTGTAPLIVGLDRYATASELAFYGTKRVDTVIETSSSNLFGGMGLMYERWTPARLQRGKTLLLVAWSPGELADKEIESHAERLDPIAEGTLTRDGHVVRHYYYRVAYNYRTPDPAETPQ
jgi:dolichol-phosphate mannosyltransferase